MKFTNFTTTLNRVQGGAVVAPSPPTSEVVGANFEPYMGKMVVSYRWLAVYSTEL